MSCGTASLGRFDPLTPIAQTRIKRHQNEDPTTAVIDGLEKEKTRCPDRLFRPVLALMVSLDSPGREPGF